MLAISGLTALPLPAIAISETPPDFEEVRGLVREHLVGTSDSDLNRASVEGLLNSLRGKVRVVGTNSPASTNASALSKVGTTKERPRSSMDPRPTGSGRYSPGRSGADRPARRACARNAIPSDRVAPREGTLVASRAWPPHKATTPADVSDTIRSQDSSGTAR